MTRTHRLYRNPLLKVEIKEASGKVWLLRKERKGQMTEAATSCIAARINYLKRDIRHMTLASGFLGGIPYSEMEPTAWTVPEWHKIKDIVDKYGTIPPSHAKFQCISGAPPAHEALEKQWLSWLSDAIGYNVVYGIKN